MKVNKTPSTGGGGGSEAKAPFIPPSGTFYRHKRMTTKRAMNKLVKYIVEYENQRNDFKLRIERDHFFRHDGMECVGLIVEKSGILPYVDICKLGMHLGLNFYGLHIYGKKKRLLFSNNDYKLLSDADQTKWITLDD